MGTGTNCCNVCSLFLSTENEILLDGSFQDGAIKGYGNANIVREITVKGVPLVARVQLCKKDRDSEEHNSAPDDGLLAEIEALMWSRRGHCHLEDRVDYISSIVAPKLSPRHLPLMINATTRRGTAACENNNRAILMPDATTFVDNENLKTVCVEIKPKFGAVMKCDSVPVEHRHLKHVHSRYQLHQSLKMEQGVIQERSMYDPLDLFSGDGVRMERAIMALLDSPQNNLCLFIGGKRISDVSAASTFDTVHGLLCGGDCKGRSLTSVCACLAHAMAKILLQERVLEDILALQTKCQVDVQEIEKRLNGLLMRMGNRTCLSDQGDLLDVLADYCISATAKDCSIMITMAPHQKIESRVQSAKPCENGVVDIGWQNTCLEYRVTVVDLDRKSLRKIKSHAKLDRDIIEANLIM